MIGHGNSYAEHTCSREDYTDPPPDAFLHATIVHRKGGAGEQRRAGAANMPLTRRGGEQPDNWLVMLGSTLVSQ